MNVKDSCWPVRLCCFLGRLSGLVASAAAIVLVLCVLGQDFLVFPHLFVDAWGSAERDVKSLPPEVESLRIETSASSSTELWRLPSRSENKGILLVFHGNGTTLDRFHPVLRWFADQGYVTYGMEYRGYGASNGWPSGEGIMRDADAAMTLIVERERSPANQVIPVGVSMGTGFAAYTAQRYGSRALVLIAPYTNLAAVVRSRRYFGFLSVLLWNEVPTDRFVSLLRDTCVVAAHGKKDTVVTFDNTERLRSLYRGSSIFQLIADERSGHNDIIRNSGSKIAGALEICAASSRG